MNDEDDALMERLGRIANEVDAPPDLAVESARAAFSMRRLDDELAELRNDSGFASTQAVRGVRSGPRLLSFESAEVSLELQIDDTEDRLVLRGLAIGTVGDAEIETTTTGLRAAPIDENSMFGVEGLPVEPLRVRVRTATGTAVTTGWIRP